MKKREFKAMLVKKGINVEKLAKKIGLDRATLYRKVNNNTLTLTDINNIIQALDLTEDETMAIFFKNEIA